MARLTNSEILALAKDNPNYKSWTSKLTDEIFTTAGYAGFDAADPTLKGEFFKLLVRVYLDQVRGPQIRIPSTFEKIVWNKSNPYGGVAQRIRTKVLKPTDPRYRGLVQGGSVDPFVVRLLDVDEEFWKQNFDYANNLTIQDIDLKKVFLDQYGINELLDKIYTSFDDSKKIQEYSTTVKMVDNIINRATLKDAQTIEVAKVDESATNATMSQFIQAFHNLKDMMDSTVYSGQFNEKGFEHGLNPSNYVLFVRAEILNQIKTTLMATTYHTENLGIPFEVVGVKDFGGTTYTKDNPTPGGDPIAMKEVYSTNKGNLGEMIGYNASGSESDPVEDIDDLNAVDHNPLVDAVLIEKGAIFISDQQPYQTSAIYNPAGRYTNFWASQPNRTIGYDGSYDVIKFVHSNS